MFIFFDIMNIWNLCARLFLRGFICTDFHDFRTHFHRFDLSNHHSHENNAQFSLLLLPLSRVFSGAFFFRGSFFYVIFWQYKSHSLFIIAWKLIIFVHFFFSIGYVSSPLEYEFFIWTVWQTPTANNLLLLLRSSLTNKMIYSFYLLPFSKCIFHHFMQPLQLCSHFYLPLVYELIFWINIQFD